MKRLAILAAGVLALNLGALAHAGGISGEYLEARSCDIYIGPCFANAEIGLAGKEAVMAWKVDEGSWAGQNLAGLGAALIVKADDTLSFGSAFSVNVRKVASLIVIDDKATSEQRDAFVKFIKETAPHLTRDVVRVESAPITLTNDHLSGKGVFSAGNLAKIETRKVAKGDCVCSNEEVFYPPLAKVDNAHAAYTLNMSYSGKGLDSNWTVVNKPSAFLATFER
jgi:hypothetical protein